jgi:hypothetical protein
VRPHGLRDGIFGGAIGALLGLALVVAGCRACSSVARDHEQDVTELACSVRSRFRDGGTVTVPGRALPVPPPAWKTSQG